jgi:hypothetical protein
VSRAGMPKVGPRQGRAGMRKQVSCSAAGADSRTMKVYAGTHHFGKYPSCMHLKSYSPDTKTLSAVMKSAILVPLDWGLVSAPAARSQV